MRKATKEIQTEWKPEGWGTGKTLTAMKRKK